MVLTVAFLVASVYAADELQIRTIAGTGATDGPVAGVMATGSSVGSGWAVAFDAQDRLHITTVDGAVWRIGTDGTWEFLWRAEGGALLFGLAIDPLGSIVVSDQLSGNVYRIKADGTSAVIASSLDYPTGLAIDAEGNVYVAEAARIRLLAPDGASRVYVDGVGGGSLAIDADGNVYAGDFAGSEVYRISTERITKIADASMLGIAVCPESTVYFTDLYRLQRVGTGVVAGGLERTFVGDDGPASEARFITPLALACDSQNRLVIYDASAAKLRQVSQ
ncbi:MAG: hypothetical protein U0R19_21470 [Bryobacteraceae bacterium]